MKVRDAMTQSVILYSADTHIASALQLMWELSCELQLVVGSDGETKSALATNRE
jgi:predicted transcriptional regulator